MEVLRCMLRALRAAVQVLGERDLFYEQVREAFIETFNFRGERGGAGGRAGGPGSVLCCSP